MLRTKRILESRNLRKRLILNEKIEGKFYEPELQKTNLKDYAKVEKVLKTKTVNGKKKYYVKFDGYDSKFNDWVDSFQK